VEPQIAYAQSRGLSVAYSVTGDAPLDLVVVPGFVSHIEAAFEQPAIAHVIRRLASFARVITFDKPGTGLSDPVAGAPTLEERMEDLTAVLDAAGSECAALFGVSEGAPMSALFAATHPDRTRALVMYGSYARGLAADDYPWAPAPEQVEAGLELIGSEWGSGALLEIYAPSKLGDQDFVRWWGRYQRLAASPAMAKAVVRLAADVDIRDILEAIAVPTLVLHRTGDPLWPVEGARFMAERIPGAQLVELEGYDHFPFVGDVEALCGETESFLTGTRQAPAPDRQLLTVLFTDIVGSTARASELGDRSWRGLLEAHDELVRDRIARFRGREVKATGDGFLATFDGPARGVECARAIVAGVRALGIEVRAGVHTGEVEIRGDDIGGMAVHIGARIGAAAGAGEVLVSSTVKDLVVGSGIEFEPRGARELRGVPGEWALFAATAGPGHRPPA
jgi:pimeloyl-ACP methyl ester carboxylesterase